MDEREWQRWQDDMEMGELCVCNLQAILDHYEESSVWQLYQSNYEAVDCGPWLAVELHDGRRLSCDELRPVKVGDVRAVQIGSIVEGSDAEIEGEWLDLVKFDTPEAAVEAFVRDLVWVNDEACYAWREANEDEDEDEDEEVEA